MKNIFKSFQRTRSTTKFDRYWSYDEVVEYMNTLASDNSEIAEVAGMGRTHENREIPMLRVTNETNLALGELPIVLVTAGTSGRDWISTMAAVALMHELTAHYEDYRHIVDDLEWFIIPIANPDGYEFSRTEGVG